MHPNSIFRQSPRTRDIAFVRDRSFGILTLNAAERPLVAHIPFQLSEDGRRG